MKIMPWLLLVLMPCCVTQSTFDALQHERDQTVAGLKGELSKTQSDLAKFQAALAEQVKRDQEVADMLTAKINRVNAEMANATKDKTMLQHSIDEMTIALASLEKRRAEAEARVAEFRNLLAKFKSLIDAGKLRVKIVDGRMVVVLATDILFNSGSANLSRDGKTALAEVALVLASIPKRSFQVEGHSDNVPISTAQYPSNWELAAARALNVLKAMVDAGLPADRVSAASFADSRPAASNDTPEGKAANRRIEITIVPDLSTLPGFDELQKIEKNG